MRCATLVVAACAIAGALAVPVRELGDLEKSFDNALSKKEDVFVDSNDSTVGGQFEEGGLSTKERIRQRIAELRDAIASAIADWPNSIGGRTIEDAVASEKVVKRLGELRDELMVKMREIMIPDDDVPVTYVVDEKTQRNFDDLKKNISDYLNVISDWKNCRAKIAETKKIFTNLSQRAVYEFRKWRRAKDSAAESPNHTSDPIYDDQYMIMAKNTMEYLKVQIELKMLQHSCSNTWPNQEIMAHLEEIYPQVTESLEAIRKIYEMQEVNTDVGTIKLLETEILNIRRRLIEAVQDPLVGSSS